MPHRYQSVATPFIGSSNVYRDLGFPDADAMLAKAKLASTLSELIAKKSWSPSDTAARMNCSRRHVTAILRGHFRQISVQELATTLALLGTDGVAADIPKDQKVRAGASRLS